MFERQYKIYLILAGDAAMKIGVSLNPEERLEELQTGNHLELRLIASFYCGSQKKSMRVEKDLHRILSKWHIRGEWFRPNLAKAVKVMIEMCGGNTRIK